MTKFSEHFPDHDFSIPEKNSAEAEELDLTQGFRPGTLKIVNVLSGINESGGVDEENPVVINPFLPITTKEGHELRMEEPRLDPVYDIKFDSDSLLLFDVYQVEFEKSQAAFLEAIKSDPEKERVCWVAIHELAMLITSIIDIVSFVPSRCPKLAIALAELRQGKRVLRDDVLWKTIIHAVFTEDLLEHVGPASAQDLADPNFYTELEEPIVPNMMSLMLQSIFPDLNIEDYISDLLVMIRAFWQGISLQECIAGDKFGFKEKRELNFESFKPLVPSVVDAIRGIDISTRIDFNVLDLSTLGKTRGQRLEIAKQKSCKYRQRRAEFYYGVDLSQVAKPKKTVKRDILSRLRPSSGLEGMDRAFGSKLRSVRPDAGTKKMLESHGFEDIQEIVGIPGTAGVIDLAEKGYGMTLYPRSADFLDSSGEINYTQIAVELDDLVFTSEEVEFCVKDIKRRKWLEKISTVERYLCLEFSKLIIRIMQGVEDGDEDLAFMKPYIEDLRRGKTEITAIMAENLKGFFPRIVLSSTVLCNTIQPTLNNELRLLEIAVASDQLKKHGADLDIFAKAAVTFLSDLFDYLNKNDGKTFEDLEGGTGRLLEIINERYLDKDKIIADYKKWRSLNFKRCLGRTRLEKDLAEGMSLALFQVYYWLQGARLIEGKDGEEGTGGQVGGVGDMEVLPEKPVFEVRPMTEADREAYMSIMEQEFSGKSKEYYSFIIGLLRFVHLLVLQFLEEYQEKVFDIDSLRKTVPVLKDYKVDGKIYIDQKTLFKFYIKVCSKIAGLDLSKVSWTSIKKILEGKELFSLNKSYNFLPLYFVFFMLAILGSDWSDEEEMETMIGIETGSFGAILREFCKKEVQFDVKKFTYPNRGAAKVAQRKGLSEQVFKECERMLGEICLTIEKTSKRLQEKIVEEGNSEGGVCRDVGSDNEIGDNEVEVKYELPEELITDEVEYIGAYLKEHFPIYLAHLRDSAVSSFQMEEVEAVLGDLSMEDGEGSVNLSAVCEVVARSMNERVHQRDAVRSAEQVLEVVRSCLEKLAQEAKRAQELPDELLTYEEAFVHRYVALELNLDEERLRNSYQLIQEHASEHNRQAYEDGEYGEYFDEVLFALNETLYQGQEKRKPYHLRDYVIGFLMNVLLRGVEVVKQTLPTEEEAQVPKVTEIEVPEDGGEIWRGIQEDQEYQEDDPSSLDDSSSEVCEEEAEGIEVQLNSVGEEGSVGEDSPLSGQVNSSATESVVLQRNDSELPAEDVRAALERGLEECYSRLRSLSGPVRREAEMLFAYFRSSFTTACNRKLIEVVENPSIYPELSEAAKRSQDHEEELSINEVRALEFEMQQVKGAVDWIVSRVKKEKKLKEEFVKLLENEFDRFVEEKIDEQFVLKYVYLLLIN